MKKMFQFCLLAAMLSCQSETVTAEFIEINNNMARFDIMNNTNQDVEKISFELKFINTSDDLISKDTLVYNMESKAGEEHLHFIKSKDKTFIVNKVPENCTKAEIKILEIEFAKE